MKLTDRNIITRPYKFDYMGTLFHSDCLYLKKAVSVLKQHPWVKYISDIKEVPYYNQNEKDNKKYIEVTIYPDQDTYSKLWKDLLDSKTAFAGVRLKELIHDGYRPTEESNLLGLLQCSKKS